MTVPCTAERRLLALNMLLVCRFNCEDSDIRSRFVLVCFAIARACVCVACVGWVNHLHPD